MNETKKDEESVGTGGKEKFKRTKPVLTAPEIIELGKAAEAPAKQKKDEGKSR